MCACKPWENATVPCPLSAGLLEVRISQAWWLLPKLARRMWPALDPFFFSLRLGVQCSPSCLSARVITRIILSPGQEDFKVQAHL